MYTAFHQDYINEGLRPDSSASQLKTIYKLLCLKHHPDRGGSLPRFLATKASYETMAARLARREPLYMTPVVQLHTVQPQVRVQWREEPVAPKQRSQTMEIFQSAVVFMISMVATTSFCMWVLL